MNPYIVPGLKDVKVPARYLNLVSDATIDSVVDAVCDVYCVDRDLLTKKIRKRNIVEARHVISWILVRRIGVSMSNVGKNVLGGRDHTTIINSVRMFSNLYDTDENFRAKSNLVMEKLTTWTTKN